MRRINFYRIKSVAIACVMACLFQHSAVIAQGDSEEVLNRQRSIFILNIAQQLRANNFNELNTYKIGVLGSSGFTKDLKTVGSSRSILGKQVSVVQYNNISEIGDIQLLYVNNDDQQNIRSILSKITGKQTLIVSENYGFNESMVNILVFGLSIEFELNESRLQQEGFVVPSRLKEQGISSSVKWQELYRHTERQLEKERQKVNQQSEALKQQQQTLTRQQQELQKLETLTTGQKEELNKQYSEITSRNDSILKLQEGYLARVEELSSLEEQILKQDSLSRFQKHNLEKTEKEIGKMDSVLAMRLAQIEQQKGELIDRDLKLQLERRNNLLLGVLAISILISSFFIFWGYLRNKRANKELISINKQKNELIGVVAHDLRSPINQVKGLANIMMLTETKLEASSKELIDKIIDSCDRLTTMIGRILNVNAIESKKIILKVEKVNLNEMMGQIATNFKVLADEKRIAIHQIYPETDVFAQADRNYLLQVMENIVSNAIKFSESEKNIHLTVDSDNNAAIMSVKDEGPGISDEDQQKLFGAFSKLSATPTAGEDSSGLGLSIAKKYIEAMNGQIKCISQIDQGATFQLSFQQA